MQTREQNGSLAERGSILPRSREGPQHTFEAIDEEGSGVTTVERQG